MTLRPQPLDPEMEKYLSSAEYLRWVQDHFRHIRLQNGTCSRMLWTSFKDADVLHDYGMQMCPWCNPDMSNMVWGEALREREFAMREFRIKEWTPDDDPTGYRLERK